MWADTFVTSSGLGAALATPGQVVGIRGVNTTEYGARVSPGNGGEVNFLEGVGFDGEDAIEIIPPTTGLSGPGSNPAYCSYLDGIDLTNGGSTEIYQINLAFVVRFGSRYVDLASAPKWLSFAVSSSPSGSFLNRAAVFEGYTTLHTGRVFGVTADETQGYFNPQPNDCWSVDCGLQANLAAILRSAANHGGSPPIIGPNEDVHFEVELDVRQNRGNAFGRNKLTIRTRDGSVNRSIFIPLNHEATWSFLWDCIVGIEGIGWYWNFDTGTAHEDNWIRFTHTRLSANRDVDDPIGPPPGFLESGDTTPNAFSFTDQTGVALSSTITSAAITVSGIDAAATISVSGGSYDINGSGTFVTTPGTVNNGDTVRARHTSSASHETATNTIVTIGGVSDTFTSTTEAAEPGEDTTPNAFTFTDQTDVALSTVITSAAITVAGIDAPATISVTGGTYDINGSGTFVSTPGTVEVGDTVRARHTSSASYSTATNTVVTIGGVSDTFTSTTEEDEIIIPAYRWFRVPRR